MVSIQSWASATVTSPRRWYSANAPRPTGRSRLRRNRRGGQPRVRAQHVRGDGGAGGVAPRLQQSGQAGAGPAAIREPRVRAHAVLRRQEAGEHGDVGGQGQRRRGPGVAEEDGVRAQAIQRRGGHARVPVSGQVVRAEGVHGNEHHGRPHGHPRRAGGRPAGGRDQREGEQPAVPGKARSYEAIVPTIGSLAVPPASNPLEMTR
jgi:hypothetical protein